MADEELKIEVETEAQPEVKIEGAPEKKPEIITGEEGAAELKRRLDTETAARQEAENRERDARAQAARDRAEIESSNRREIDTGIDIVKRNLEVAKSNYRTAREKGDVDAELEATEAIAQARAEMLQLEAGKAAQNARPKTQQPAHDPVEALAATLAPKSAAWIRSHPDFARNQQLYTKMVAASNFVLAGGIAPESDEYYQKVEDMLGVRAATQAPSKEQEITLETPLSAASRPAAPAAAPVSRNGAGPGAPKPGTVRLSREQAEVAEASFPLLVKEKGPGAAHKAYAESMLAARANGRIN